MNTTALRELIRRAHLSEAHRGHLVDLIASCLPRLYYTIQPQGENTENILARFVHAYVGQAPDLLDAASSIVHEAGIEKWIKPVLKIAEQFFLTPLVSLAGHDDLDVLLDEAYLAHCLVKEMNDHYIAHFGQILIPLDTTVANLATRQLIGESFANRLDETVHHAVESMPDTTTLDAGSTRAHRESLESPWVVTAQQQWPCLSRQLGVELSLG